MNGPKLLLAVPLKESDYEWSDAEKPELTVPVHTAQPQTVSAEQLAANMEKYCEELTRDPDWREKLLRKNQERKEARLAERRNRKKAA